jgi:hypothetical protein
MLSGAIRCETTEMSDGAAANPFSPAALRVERIRGSSDGKGTRDQLYLIYLSSKHA